jgi:hypothetical protein
MKILILASGLILAFSVHAFEVREAASSLWLDCSAETGALNSCQKLCDSNQCKIAELTCDGCARASDPMFVGILKRFHRLYDTNENSHSPEALKPWIANGFFIAINANSPLNIFADPFSEEDTQELANSFDRVCGQKGNHYVLAQQGNNLKPQGIICQQADGWKIKSLKYRSDYFSTPAQEIPVSLKP